MESKKYGKDVRNISYELTLVFIALRACGVTAWAWYWVLSPMLITTFIGILVLLSAWILQMFISRS